MPRIALDLNDARVSPNPLRLAIFGANCSSGRTYATLPERWDASWENNLRLAQLADEIGIEAMVPIARWKGSTEAGRGFAIRHSDMHFDAVETPEASAGRIAETKRLARAHGHDIQVWTPVGVICRPTQKEADEYVQYVVDHADWSAIGYLAEMHAKDGRPRTDPQHLIHSGRNPAERRALARGSYCVIGDPDAVAREFSRLRSAGLDGLAINFVDYLQELPYFAGQVLPRMVRLGLRVG